VRLDESISLAETVDWNRRFANLESSATSDSSGKLNQRRLLDLNTVNTLDFLDSRRDKKPLSFVAVECVETHVEWRAAFLFFTSNRIVTYGSIVSPVFSSIGLGQTAPLIPDLESDWEDRSDLGETNQCVLSLTRKWCD
jgi:hypothetical protein